MKCISLWQPWASYIADGRKKIETRHWPTRYRGPILIHAAKRTTECSESQRRDLNRLGESYSTQAQAAFAELLRLARLGAAVEAMPPGWLLEREDWNDHAWNCHKGARGPETTLQPTPQAALDDLQQLLKITE